MMKYVRAARTFETDFSNTFLIFQIIFAYLLAFSYNILSYKKNVYPDPNVTTKYIEICEEVFIIYRVCKSD